MTEPNTDDEWADAAAGWDDDEVVRAYAAAAFASLVDWLGGVEHLRGCRVLDFGCGTGVLTESLIDAGASVVAVDSSPAMLSVLEAKCVDHGWSNVVVASDLPEEMIADLVVCSSVLAFVDDLGATVRRLVAALEPGGHFVQWDWERTGDDDHGLTREEMRQALAEAGLIDVEVRIGFELAMGDVVARPLMGSARTR